jgi:hypothetical protein
MAASTSGSRSNGRSSMLVVVSLVMVGCPLRLTA